MSEIKWKIFTAEKDGITLEVIYWAKDFTVRYKFGEITLSYYRHMMYMIPKIYTEEMLRKKLDEEDIWQGFREAEKIITVKKNFFENLRKEFAERKQIQTEQIEELNKRRRELKKGFKDGALTQKEYQKLKGEIEKEKDNFYFSNSDEIFKTANSIEAKSGCTHSILRNYLEEIWKEISPPKILPLCPQVR